MVRKKKLPSLFSVCLLARLGLDSGEGSGPRKCQNYTGGISYAIRFSGDCRLVDMEEIICGFGMRTEYGILAHRILCLFLAPLFTMILCGYDMIITKRKALLAGTSERSWGLTAVI
jgi:hypothetical protein